MKLNRRKPAAEDFQMAPMIDMVFLLLVFFMCVSSLAQADKSVPVDLPESQESKVPEDLANRGIVTVQENGTVHLGAREVSLDELKEGISQALRETPQLRVQVRADSLTRFEQIQRVLKICAEAGAVDVVYSTHQSR
jgi:biopolymer transport protein ExbD